MDHLWSATRTGTGSWQRLGAIPAPPPSPPAAAPPAPPPQSAPARPRPSLSAPVRVNAPQRRLPLRHFLPAPHRLLGRALHLGRHLLLDRLQLRRLPALFL